MSEPTPRLVRLANATLAILVLVCVLQSAFALQLGHPIGLLLVPVGAGALLCGLLFLPADSKVNLTLLAVTLFLVAIAGEIALAVVYMPPPAAETRGGASVDLRSRLEFVRDMRRAGLDIHGADAPLGPITLGGEPVAYFGAVARTTFALCNESGRYAIGTTDEYGFLNPPGLWNREGIQIVTLGDSFTAGTCVTPEKNYPGLLRAEYPLTINLGRGGNSPLGELAGLLEYAERLRPRVVLWGFHDNDLYDLTRDKRDPVLPRYLDEGYRQALFDRQAELDRALAARLAELERRAVRHPVRRDDSGPAPLWLGDLLHGTSRTTFARVLRFQHLNQRLDVEYRQLWREPHDFVLFRDIMTRARDAVAGWGGQLYFVYLPSWGILKFSSMHRDHADAQHVLALVEELGIPVIDPREKMRARDTIDELFFYPHSHYNETGYRVVAEEVLETLQARAEGG